MIGGRELEIDHCRGTNGPKGDDRPTGLDQQHDARVIEEVNGPEFVQCARAPEIKTGVAGMNAATSSPSYIDGSNFAAMQYPNATPETSLCVASNAQSYDDPTQWLQGCHDGWYLAAHSFSNPGMPGLNAG